MSMDILTFLKKHTIKHHKFLFNNSGDYSVFYKLKNNVSNYRLIHYHGVTIEIKPLLFIEHHIKPSNKNHCVAFILHSNDTYVSFEIPEENLKEFEIII